MTHGAISQFLEPALCQLY